MELLTSSRVEAFLKNDLTLKRLEKISRPEDETLICQRWLRESGPKRYIYDKMYGALFGADVKSKQILDIGGGLTCFTRELARHHEYELVDLLAHDEIASVHTLERECSRHFIYPIDWNELDCGYYELVLANDIFPNVDQRLEVFLSKYLRCCKRLVMSLTWYDKPRFYKVNRVDGDEIFFMLAWSANQIQSVLEKYADRIVNYDTNIFSAKQGSLYPNGRQVCIVELIGDMEHE